MLYYRLLAKLTSSYIGSIWFNLYVLHKYTLLRYLANIYNLMTYNKLFGRIELQNEIVNHSWHYECHNLTPKVISILQTMLVHIRCTYFLFLFEIRCSRPYVFGHWRNYVWRVKWGIGNILTESKNVCYISNDNWVLILYLSKCQSYTVCIQPS